MSRSLERDKKFISVVVSWIGANFEHTLHKGDLNLKQHIYNIYIYYIYIIYIYMYILYIYIYNIYIYIYLYIIYIYNIYIYIFFKVVVIIMCDFFQEFFKTFLEWQQSNG